MKHAGNKEFFWRRSDKRKAQGNQSYESKVNSGPELFLGVVA